ncbi:GNAT family N-acetyltransferase [Pseudomonas sp. 32.2.56]|uniref:GNAT family N-acetyltransferase n=1 Tax=Pseudomonas sp. 32.2.56 TaxID=2969303 RepID=UPI00214F932E|nr:GNAT family N-acetyltransferase [Pseudomonas sp. 32.2.56]MCR4511643.1 GNAT family N-acetyltransferase [Pseudomonas sp. 32.2.56]
MNAQETPFFSKSLMRLVKLSRYKDAELEKLISAINEIRSKYPWSSKQYDESCISDVYVISCQRTIFGFIECIYQDLDITCNSAISIFLHELHIAPSMQGKGAGAAVLEHLLEKGVRVEMVVANENKNMLSLVNKFNPEHKHVAENTRTVVIKNRQSCAIA